MPQAIAEELLQHIADALGDGRQEITADTRLLETRILDSTGILDLAQFMEDQYGITVADDELRPENFGSIQNLVSFVRRKLGDRA
jgi:acyl carrier protein